MSKGLAPAGPLVPLQHPGPANGELWSRYSMKDDLEFSLTDVPCSVPRNTAMLAENIDGRYFNTGEDYVFYRLSFSPPLDFATFFPTDDPANTPADTLLRASRRGERHTPLFSVRLDGDICQEERLRTAGAGIRTFYCYPTHVVESMCSPDDVSKLLVRYIYVTLENNQLSESPDAPPQIELHVAMDTFYLPHCSPTPIAPASGGGDGKGGATGTRYNGLPFFPLDVHLRKGAEALVDFLPALAGQRVPFWYLQRGIVSGSSAGKYGAGYWVERDAAAPVGPTGAETFGPEAKARMRQGRIEEASVLLTYLHAHPTHAFYEQGYIVMDWLNPDFGVSPDGLAVDPALTWETFPCARTREEYAPISPIGPGSAGANGGAEGGGSPISPIGPGSAGANGGTGGTSGVNVPGSARDIDPQRIALEFKVSAFSTKFPDYYIPQLYWEMIAMRAPQARLLRMQVRKNQSASKCMQYTVYRDRETETALLANIQRAYEAVYVKKTQKLVDLANDPSFVAIRARFAKLAESTPGEELPVPTALVADYRVKRQQAIEFIPRASPAARAKAMSVPLPPPPAPSPVPETLVNEQGVDDQYLARHVRIKQRLAEKNIAGAVHLCVEQMNAYGQLIKTIFH